MPRPSMASIVGEQGHLCLVNGMRSPAPGVRMSAQAKHISARHGLSEDKLLLPHFRREAYLELSARQSVKTRCNEFRSYSLRMPRECTHLFSSCKCHDVHEPVRTPRSR